MAQLLDLSRLNYRFGVNITAIREDHVAFKSHHTHACVFKKPFIDARNEVPL